MKSITLMAATLAAILAVTACKKEKNIVPGNSGNASQTNSAGKTGKHVPQAKLGNDNFEVPALVKAFKQSVNKPGANARLVDEPVTLAYATSIVEATLNYDYDDVYDKNYVTIAQKTSVDIAVDKDGMVTSDDLETAYTQLKDLILEKIAAGQKIKMVNVESFMDESGGGYLDVDIENFLITEATFCELPSNWLRYPASAATRIQAGYNSDPNDACFTAWQDNDPSTSATYNNSGMWDINSALMCSCVPNNVVCDQEGGTEYWFPITTPYYMQGGSSSTDLYLYRGTTEWLSWYCGANGYMTGTTANGYITNLSNTLNSYMATISNATTPWEVASAHIVEQVGYTNYPNPSLWQKSISWSFEAQIGIRNCKPSVIGGN
jgi:hypothetical protein